MHALAVHPYRAAFVVIVILVGLGGFVVMQRSAQTTALDGDSWGQFGELNTSAVPGTQGTGRVGTLQKRFTENDVYNGLSAEKQDKYGTMVGSTPIPTATDYSEFINATTVYDQDEVAKFIESVKPSAEAQVNTTAYGEETTLEDIFSYLPTASLPKLPSFGTKYSDSQQSLYEYGNLVGSTIESFDEVNINQSNMIDAFLNDRKNQAKVDAVKRLGKGLISVGEAIKETDPLPKAAESINAKLAAGYIEVGNKLITVAESASLSDTKFVDALMTYNASSELFSGTMQSAVAFFSAAGITYKNTEPGHVFQFTPLQ